MIRVNYEFITISTKKKISKKRMNELWDSIIDIVGDSNFETGGGKTITQRKFMLMWNIAHE